jgi:hypothetical protein
VNRAPAKVQSALLEAMQERQVTIGDSTHPLPEPFLVLATQNPIEQEGTFPLPEAQLDRFMLLIRVSYPTAGEERGMLDRMSHADLQTYLVELLMKQDQMSMAASIESRVPFLDHVLVEFAAQLPPRYKLSGFTTKRILREAARDLLPAGILSRPKMGFPVPFARWARTGWQHVLREVLLDKRALERGLFSGPAVAALIDDHEGERTEGGDILWSLLNLELWYRTFVDGDGVQVLPSPAVRATRHELGQAHAIAADGTAA